MNKSQYKNNLVIFLMISILILSIFVPSVNALKQNEIKNKLDSNPEDIDVIILGGLGGFTIKIHNKGQNYYNENISFYFNIHKLPDRNQYTISIKYTEPIPPKKWITIKTRDEGHFLMGLNRIDIDLALYLSDNHDHTDGGLSKKGLLFGPFLFMIPCETTY